MMVLLRRFALWIVAIQFLMIIGIMSVYRLQSTNGWTTFTFYGMSESGDLFSDATSPPVPHPVLPETFTLSDDTRSYFTHLPNGLTCFTDGSDLIKTSSNLKSDGCTCVTGYFGTDCGIPEPVWNSCRQLKNCSEFKARKTPRRLIHGFNINHELEFFQVRMEEIGDVLDVVIVGESNLTAGGDSSPLYLLPELQNGFMGEFQHKIIHVFIDHFPPQGLTDGWFADTFIRDYMGREGLKRINGARDDDLFLLLDADEIPDRRILLYLKLYDGYPQPISLTLRWSVYGFFWKRSIGGGSSTAEDVTRIVALATLGMVRDVYDGKVMSVRRNYLSIEPGLSRVEAYTKSGHSVMEWNIGQVGSYAGFHCSWCYKPEGIRLKLVSAQKDDKPRWGDFPEKLDLNYIAGLIRDGRWFDGSKPFFLVKPEQDRFYAPAYILKHRDRFGYLLDHPGDNKTSNS